MRYFVEICYNGSHFCGWQRQPGAVTVQGRLEQWMSTLLGKETEVTGCGRTDTGVHARQYFFHFECSHPLPDHFEYRLNRVVGDDIAIKRIVQVPADLHARFDAWQRSYEYHISFDKDPFRQGFCWQFPRASLLDLDKMQLAASILLQYEQFAPLCKTGSDVKNTICELRESTWILDESSRTLLYAVSANRFLRGMVRLIVGMCVNVGLGKISLEMVRHAMDNQTMMPQSTTVPACGLYLTAVQYEFLQ